MEGGASALEALLGPRQDVIVASVQGGDSLDRWATVFSTILVRHSKRLCSITAQQPARHRTQW